MGLLALLEEWQADLQKQLPTKIVVICGEITIAAAKKPKKTLVNRKRASWRESFTKGFAPRCSFVVGLVLHQTHDNTPLSWICYGVGSFRSIYGCKRRGNISGGFPASCVDLDSKALFRRVLTKKSINCLLPLLISHPDVPPHILGTGMPKGSSCLAV
jgi:hypothetical protein